MAPKMTDPAWASEAQARTEDDSLGIIDALRNDLRDAARMIRECPDCEIGYVMGVTIFSGGRYASAAQCHCFKAFREKGRELNEAIRRYEKASGREYVGLITGDMTFHGSPTGEPASAETTERARQAIKGIELDVPEEAYQ
jgi:hypothetical protein